MEEVIVRDRRLLAEFMGWTIGLKQYESMERVNVTDPLGSIRESYPPEENISEQIKKLWKRHIERGCASYYHYSWSNLMLVIEKIESLGYQFKICRKRVEIYKDTNNEFILAVKSASKIESAFEAAVAIITIINAGSDQ